MKGATSLCARCVEVATTMSLADVQIGYGPSNDGVLSSIGINET